MSHDFNKRKISRHSRELRAAALPVLLTGASDSVLAATKETLEGLVNARGHHAAGMDLSMEKAQRLSSTLKPYETSQRYTYINENNYSVVPTDQVVVVDTAVGARIVTLPLSTAPFMSHSLLIVRVGANPLTIYPQGGELLNGAASLLFSASYDSGQFVPIHNGWLGRQTLVPGVYKMGVFSHDLTSAAGPQVVSGIGFKPAKLTFYAAMGALAPVSIGTDIGYGHMDCYTLNSPIFSTGLNHSIILVTGGGDWKLGYVSARTDDAFTVTWEKSGAPTGTAQIVYCAERV